MFQDSVPAGSYNDPFLSSVCVSRKIGNTYKIVMLMENMLANHGILMDFEYPTFRSPVKL